MVKRRAVICELQMPADVMLLSVLKRRKPDECGEVRLKSQHVDARIAEEGKKLGDAPDAAAGGNIFAVGGRIFYVCIVYAVAEKLPCRERIGAALYKVGGIEHRRKPG